MTHITSQVQETFRTSGRPTVTYVERENGRYDDLLSSSLDSTGQICLITGPSKTGKSSLYERVLEKKGQSRVLICCHRGVTVEAIWTEALEDLGAQRVTEISQSATSESSADGKISGGFGFGWLANLSGESSLGTKRGKQETQTKQPVISHASPRHILPLLSQQNRVLVLEDFHYLTDEIKEQLFQQLKVFSDGNVSVIVLGTTHRAADIARANKDLVGRICQIDLDRWARQDLERIAKEGFAHLGIDIQQEAVSLLGRESVGLPLIMQQACRQLCLDQGASARTGNVREAFSKYHAADALHHVALNNYRQLEADYEQLARGPKRQRSYDTYALLLSCFLKEPASFSLTRGEIDARLAALATPADHQPPASSVTSTLEALGKFQQDRGIELLEWDAQRRALHILEPSFLFYLRWRENQAVESVMDRDDYLRLRSEWARTY